MLTLYCVDPHPVVAAGLAALTAPHPDLAFVGSARDADTAAGEFAAIGADLVVMDPSLLGAEGFGLCRRLKEIKPDVRVVVYTDAAGVPGVSLQARVAGADGLLDKSTEPPELLDALRATGTGALAMPPLHPAELEAAARRVKPDDLALLAMLADRTAPADAADTLHLDRRGVLRRIDRMLPRLSGMRPHPA